MRRRRYWTPTEEARLRALYPDTPTETIAQQLDRPAHCVYHKAAKLGLRKSDAYLASPAACRLRRGDEIGKTTRFPPGHVPFNKGMKGYQPGGRSVETRFKKGEPSKRWDPQAYCIGALRVNFDGYIDMKVREAPGALAWRALHVILWEDAHGPVPPGHCLCFKNGDKLDVELANLELVSRAELMRRNTVHNLPKPLRSTIQVLGQLKRRIREREDRGPAKASVRHAGRAAGQEAADGHRAREGRRAGRAGDR